jgi:benzoylformate decarboxylase
MLPPAVGPLAEALAGHDLVLVVGSSVFPYYPNIPGDFLPAGAELVAITCDPDEAARAPMGEAIVADVALTLCALADELAEPSDREPPPARAELEPPPPGEQLSGGEVHEVLAELFPPDGIVVLESPSSTAALRNRLRLSRPGSYYFSASGGLGFGLSAAVCVQLAQPQRQVVCVLGEGSAQYMRSPGCGRPRPMRFPSSSWCCATTTIRSSSGSRRWRTSAGRRAWTSRAWMSRRRRRATASTPSA